MSTIAYDLYDQKLWEVKKNGKKIGFLQISPGVCTYKTKVSIEKFSTIQDLQKKYNVKLNIPSNPKHKKMNMVYDYPTSSSPFNEIWNITNKVPLYTKTKKSKSFYCAGYYYTCTDGNKEEFFCPKKINVDRNNYIGPFKSIEELKKHNC